MQHLILLHGAIGSKDQLQNLSHLLERDYRVYSLNFSGHGSENIPDRSFSIQLFADDLLRFMHQNNIERTNIFGYSMGGYVGMYIAKHHPEKILKLITLATKFYWDEPTALKEIKMLSPETIEQRIPTFAEELAKRHVPNDWKIVLKKSAEML